MIGLASGSYEPAIPTICTATMFEELRDVIDHRRGIVSDVDILRVWRNKADYIKHDSTQLRNIFRVRELLQCDALEKLRIRLEFVDSLRRLKEWSLYDESFRTLLGDSTDERVLLLQAKSRHDRLEVKCLDEFMSIIKRLKQGPDYCNAVCGYCRRSVKDPFVLPLISSVLAEQPTSVRALKYWSYFNLGCTSGPNPEVYASNAIQGFANLIKHTRASLHYLCQLCSIFFQYGSRLSNFASAAESLTTLSAESVIQIIPQLMVQFDNPDPAIRRVVLTVVGNFARSHFQALLMPLLFFTRTATISEDLAAFMESLRGEFQLLMDEAVRFTDGLLKLAVSSVEEAMILLERLAVQVDEGRPPAEIQATARQIEAIFFGTKTGPLSQVFQEHGQRKFGGTLRDFLNNGRQDIQLANMAVSVKQRLTTFVEALQTLDLAELDPALCNTPPRHLVIPGFYAVGKAPEMIVSIGHIVKLIPSAKRPRKIRINGSNGIQRKYLLKGREDLRLDQRVMQFFSLTNSILHDDKFGVEKHLHIRQVPVVPLSPNAGLIAWAEGGETVYSMITWHRRIMGVDGNDEQLFLKRYLADDRLVRGDKEMTLRLTAIQKLELHRELCALAPDDDIRETMWLRSQSAALWLSRVTKFARSNGLMSIVGYIMGIGDRHPSNILVMKRSGNVVHIDFSDCFEKASLRTFVRETVPFRLTRMLVKALGPSGIHGVFSITAEYVMELMRKNRDTLLAFLDIFVQDPITDTIWYRNAADVFGREAAIEDPNAKGGMLKQAISRVSRKLNGCEFETVMNEKEQVGTLIKIAMDQWNLSQMYYGWAPFW
jgi:FKBP12-rapamycin complex-associated protein